LVLTATLAILAIGIFYIAENVLVDGFSKVEDSEAAKDYSRLRDAVSGQVDQMSARTMDYAKWTAMHDYVQKPNRKFEKENLIVDSLVNLNIDFMAVVRNDGNVLYYVSRDSSVGRKTKFADQLLRKVQRLNKEILDSKTNKPTSGLLVVGNRVLCISTQPAVNSDGSGQASGFVMMGSVYSSNRINAISGMIHLDARIATTDALSKLIKVNDQTVRTGDGATSIPLSLNVMRTYESVNDLEGRKSVLLVVDSPRVVNRQMLETRAWLIFALLAAGILIFFTSVWLVDRVVTSRLVSLSNSASAIAASANASTRVDVRGADEIGLLAVAVNAMLDSIQNKTSLILDAQKEIEKNERRYLQVIESTNAGIYEFNRVTNRIKVNDELKAIFEWEGPEEEVGLDQIRESFHPDDRPDLRDLMFENLNINTTFALDLRIVAKVGGYRWIHVTGKKLKDVDSQDIIVGSVVDITTKKTAELELLKIYQLTELSDDLISMADLEGNVIYVNPSGVAMTGLDPSKGSILPKAIEYFPESEHERLHNQILPELFQTGRWAGEVQFLRPDRKSTFLMSQTTIKICDPKTNEPTCFGTVSRDITAQRQAEQELAKARDAALDLARVKATFLANMSHEIRTPMNGIIGMVGLLADTSLNEEQKDFTRIIQNSAESLLAIINDILDFSKIEAGKLTIEEIKFNLRDLIEESVRLLADSAHRKGIEVICRIPPELPDCCISDPTRIRQVLMNLVGNAIKFTEKGRVVVSAEQTNSDMAKPSIKVSVVDTGIGIAEEKHATVFDSFTQADNSSSRRFGGTGLGLTISRQIVELLGGQIGLDSAVGQGSTFWFEITVQKAEPNEKKTPVRKLNAAYTVLAVDDDETNRLVYRENLKAWNINCLECKDGLEAISELNDRQGSGIDAILMDLQMPAIDGIQTTAAIRELPGCMNIPIILVTSSGQGYNKDELADMGISAFLNKPIIQSKLFDLLANILNGEESAEVDRQANREEDLAGMSFLLVEDNPVNRKVGIKTLQKMGAEVTVAENGKEGVEKWLAGQFDCVLMDCQMPVMDGFEATEQIRQLEGSGESRTVIIAMTAGTSDQDRQKSKDCGMDAFLTKPIRPLEVLTVLKRGLSCCPDAGQGIASKSVFDAQRLIEICDGDQSFLKQIVAEFEESSHGVINELTGFLADGDLDKVRRSAHKLKGSCRNIGGDRLATICEELELCAKTGVNAGLNEIIDRMRDALEDLMGKLRVVQAGTMSDAA